MNSITILGLVAATCTTMSFLPQAIKTIKTKHTKDISLVMYSIMVLGLSLWLVYGILINNLPIIMANIFSASLSATILVLKIKHG